MLAAAMIWATDALETWRLQDSNAVNETFWDAQNLEIEACANFDDFSGPGKNYGDWMLGAVGCSPATSPPVLGVTGASRHW